MTHGTGHRLLPTIPPGCWRIWNPFLSQVGCGVAVVMALPNVTVCQCDCFLFIQEYHSSFSLLLFLSLYLSLYLSLSLSLFLSFFLSFFLSLSLSLIPLAISHMSPLSFAVALSPPSLSLSLFLSLKRQSVHRKEPCERAPKAPPLLPLSSAVSLSPAPAL